MKSIIAGLLVVAGASFAQAGLDCDTVKGAADGAEITAKIGDTVVYDALTIDLDAGQAEWTGGSSAITFTEGDEGCEVEFDARKLVFELGDAGVTATDKNNGDVLSVELN